MTAPARIGRLVAASSTLLLLVAGCGDDAGTTSGSSSATTAASEPSDASSSSAASPSAEPSKVPLDRSVLTKRQPSSMTQPVMLVNGAAKGTVIAVRPVSVKPATPAGLAGLKPENRAEVKGKQVYFLTYEVSYVNGRVEDLAPYVTLGLWASDVAPFTSVIIEGAEGDARDCRRADTAGKTFGAGSSYTECSIEVAPPGSKPRTIQYTDYTTPDVRPVWPIG